LEFKLVTWSRVGYCELKLWLIHIAVGGEQSSPRSDIEDLHAVPEVRVHSSDVQGEGRGPGEEDGCLLRVYSEVAHCSQETLGKKVMTMLELNIQNGMLLCQ